MLTTGATLFYTVAGTGPPLLVVHGGLGFDHSYFRPWLDPLAEQFQLIYVDLRGNGRSDELPDHEYTHTKMVADLHALRQALGVERWAVLGHSYGGFVTQQYALDYPDEVSALILTSTSPAPIPLLSLTNADAREVATRQLTPEIRAALARQQPPQSDQELRTDWYTILPLYFYKYDWRAFIADDRVIYRHRVAAYTSMYELQHFDTRPRLRELRAPTLVLVGRYDWRTPVEHSRILAESIPIARLLIFAESGHFPFIEEPQAFRDAVRQFLGPGTASGSGSSQTSGV